MRQGGAAATGNQPQDDAGDQHLDGTAARRRRRARTHPEYGRSERRNEVSSSHENARSYRTTASGFRFGDQGFMA